MYQLINRVPRPFVRMIDPQMDIPMDEANTDYQRYLAWLADGNEPEIIEG